MSRGAEPCVTLPTSENTNREIEAFAAAHGVSLKGATNKAQRLAMIEEALNGS